MSEPAAKLEMMQQITPLEVAAARATGVVTDYVGDDGDMNAAVSGWCEAYNRIRMHIIEQHASIAT